MGERLDMWLVRKGHFDTRSRARDAIRRGTVTIDGMKAAKAGQFVTASARISIQDPARHHVSRAALKLIAALDHFALDPQGCHALDIGASTGGFSEVLLERGAAHVIAVDVGHAQLSKRLQDDSRMTSREGLNARDLTRADCDGYRIGAVVSDVSFISVTLALPPALNLADSGAFAVLLIKPQFEAGREAITRQGLVKDAGQAEAIAQERARWLDQQPGWRTLGLIASPITGGDGNREYLLAAIKDRKT